MTRQRPKDPYNSFVPEYFPATEPSYYAKRTQQDGRQDGRQIAAFIHTAEVSRVLPEIRLHVSYVDAAPSIGKTLTVYRA